MRVPLSRPRRSVLATTLAVLVLLPACTVEAGDEAAHAIAEKFASDSEPVLASKPSAKETPAKRVAESTVAPAPVAQAEPAAQPPMKIISQPIEPKPSAAQKKRSEAKRLAREKAEAERRALEQRKADEQDILARARAEAEQRRLAQEQRLKEIERAEAEAERLRAARAAEERERKLAEEKRIAAAEEARKAAEAQRLAEQRRREEEEQRKAQEARRLAEIAAQEEARRLAEQKRVAEEERVRREADARRLAEQEEIRRAAEERRIAAERLLAEEEARRIAQAKAVAELAERNHQAELARQRDQEEARIVQRNFARLEAEREAEAQHLSDKLKQIREARAEDEVTFQPPQGLGGPRDEDFDFEDEDDTQPHTRSTRVTILLLMEPGDRGIRRFNKSADPILCLNRGCYVSRGAGEPAEEISRGRAFGPGVALGSRAGSCSNSLTCVFRNVDLGGPSADVQPIDLRVLRHDRREVHRIEADRTCRIASRQLRCRRPVIANSYTLWVVPESLAERAGEAALETAVHSDSFYDHSASLNR